MVEPFKIHTLHEYLNFYIEESERIFSKYEYLKTQRKDSQKLFRNSQSDSRSQSRKFFVQLARINTLEAEILIILECIELRRK